MLGIYGQILSHLTNLTGKFINYLSKRWPTFDQLCQIWQILVNGLFGTQRLSNFDEPVRTWEAQTENMKTYFTETASLVETTPRRKNQLRPARRSGVAENLRYRSNNRGGSGAAGNYYSRKPAFFAKKTHFRPAVISELWKFAF